MSINLADLKEYMEKNKCGVTLGIGDDNEGIINYDSIKSKIRIIKTEKGSDMLCSYNKNIINTKNLVFELRFINITSYKTADLYINEYVRKLKELINFFKQ